MSENGYPKVVIVGGARTPIGVKCGTLSRFAPEDLAERALALTSGISKAMQERYA